jgi:hypothetical protein
VLALELDNQGSEFCGTSESICVSRETSLDVQMLTGPMSQQDKRIQTIVLLCSGSELRANPRAKIGSTEPEISVLWEHTYRRAC